MHLFPTLFMLNILFFYVPEIIVQLDKYKKKKTQNAVAGYKN